MGENTTVPTICVSHFNSKDLVPYAHGLGLKSSTGGIDRSLRLRTKSPISRLLILLDSPFREATRSLKNQSGKKLRIEKRNAKVEIENLL